MRRLHLGLGLLGAAAVAAPALLVAQAGSPAGSPDTQALVSAAGWRDVVDGQRTPQVPPAGETESAIVLLDGPGLVDVPAADRATALERMQADQLALEGSLQGMGGVVTHRYRTLLNGLGVRVPAGRLSTLAEVRGIRAVVPVLFMAPAASDASPVAPTGQGPQGTAPAPEERGPERVALIDAAVDASHPWLGGGIGPDKHIVAAMDVVEGDADPSPDMADPAAEAHGTQMASIILRSPALAGLSPAMTTRMLAYRVTAREVVDGRVRTLARTDRVLAALEMAVDPNRDGMPDDRAGVIVMGLARAFGAGGIDPVASAVAAADRAGSVVVVPAGNDGPTGTSRGTLGNLAAVPQALVVGGIAGAQAPRTAELTMSVGPASATLAPLPLMGADPAGVVTTGAPLVAASGDAGVGAGTDIRDFAGAGGRSTVAGAVALVARSGAPIAEVARRAASAGAVALAVWDEDGAGAFPGIHGGADVPIPIVGLGPAQGRALMEMLVRQPGAAVAIAARADQQAPMAVASFSSRGPTADGRAKPDIVAPAVGVEAAFPGRDQSGTPRQAPLHGTSAAAASVAAAALRLRVDHPTWTPADVRSVLVQSAGQVPGAQLHEQGGGVVADPASIAQRAMPGVSITPPVISGIRSRTDDTRLRFVMRDLTGTGGRYRLVLQTPAGEYEPVGDPVVLTPGQRRGATVAVPRAARSGDDPWRGRLLVVPEGGQVAAGSAVVWAAPRAPFPKGALGTPVVRRTGTGLGQVEVRVGTRDLADAGLVATTLRDVRVELVPVGGGTPVRMTQAEPSGDWPAATYRLLLSRRSAAGPEVPAGRYRAVVTATDANGSRHIARSRPFTVGS